MWDRFHQILIYGLLTILVVGCVGCSVFGGGELSDKELIEAVAEAGCKLESIKRQDGKIEKLDCHDTVRVIHER